MSYYLRRLPLSRLLVLCGLVLALGASATAIAFALGSGPTPPAKPLAEAVHDALTAPPVEGVSARIQLTNHLLEGANLASGSAGSAGELTSSPLLSGASGRLWIAKDGRTRLELQAEKGDTQILWDGHTVQLYDAATNTLYRYTPPADQSSSSGESSTPADQHEAPNVTRIEEAISHLSEHADVSGATPTDIAGQAAYTVRISPKEGGSLLGGAELSWDAVHGVPLRAAIYSSTSSAPVIELDASSISYGPVESSVFEFTPPSGAKVEEVKLGTPGAQPSSSPGGADHPKLTTFGHGPSTIAVLEHPAREGSGSSTELPEGLQKVEINGVSAAELQTELGTLLSFERSGVHYLLLGAVPPAAIEAVAKGL
jgi:outer membrane lipoprotein-sorting protein